MSGTVRARRRWLVRVLAPFMVAGMLAAELPAVASAAGVEQEAPTKVDVPVPVSPAVEPLQGSTALPPGDLFRAPTASDLGEYQLGPDVDPTPVRELVEARTATSERWLNADGSFTEKSFTEPKYYLPAGSKEWVPIDNAVVVDRERKGWYRNAGNSWTVQFGPIESDGSSAVGGVVLDAEGQHIEFAPRSAAPGVFEPEVDLEAGVVTYRGVWPNVDLRYSVRS